MKIVHINTHDIRGGAARAAYRLHRGLRAIGQNSTLVCRHKFSDDNTVLQVEANPIQSSKMVEQLALLQQKYVNENRTPLSNTLFSLPFPGIDVNPLLLKLEVDVIHLHWVAYFLSGATLRELSALHRPIVWTLHDMWPFTGGCHYSAGCDRYQNMCPSCPQLADNPVNLPLFILQDRADWVLGSNITVVTPSQWLAEIARKSRMFRHHRIEVIPNGVETNVFVPIDKAEAKQRVGIAPDTLTMLFGAESATERRKGFEQLMQAMQLCRTDARFQELIDQGRVTLLTFGVPSQEMRSLNLPIQPFGTIHDDGQLAQCYAAADLFVLPSLEDNLPNTMLEAMSCGIPVVAFATGGIPDFVKTDLTGKLAPVGDVQALAKAMLDGLFDAPLRQHLSKNCHAAILRECAPTLQAQRYQALYQDLVSKNTDAPPLPHPPAGMKLVPEKQSGAIALPLSTTLERYTAEIFPHAQCHLLSGQIRELQATLDQTTQQNAQLQATNAQLQAAIAHLSTGRVALKTMVKAVLRRLGIGKRSL